MAGIDLGRFGRKKKDEWLDWLTDDPVPASIRVRMRAKAVKEAARTVVRRPGQAPVVHHVSEKPTAKPAAVSINITIPKLKLHKPSVKIPPQLIAHKKWIVGGSLAVVLVAGVAVTIFATQKDDKNGNTPAVLAEKSQRADFAYSLPKGSAEETDGDVRYDAEHKVVNFKDSIGGVEITISQQPLPESFKEDTDNKVKKLAADFSATKEITTANPTAYLGTSVKGPQTVIFSKKDLLVFIQSTKTIDEHDWAEYITSLQ
jgi:hypothetical protein